VWWGERYTHTVIYDPKKIKNMIDHILHPLLLTKTCEFWEFLANPWSLKLFPKPAFEGLGNFPI